jgi:hypothetical protein
MTKMKWSDHARDLLNELISPVPSLERAEVKQAIKRQVEELASEAGHSSVNREEWVVCGYWLSAPAPAKRLTEGYLRKKGYNRFLTSPVPTSSSSPVAGSNITDR